MKFNYNKKKPGHVRIKFTKWGWNVSLRKVVKEKNHTRLCVMKKKLFIQTNMVSYSGFASENTRHIGSVFCTHILMKLIWTCVLRWKIIYHNARTHEHIPLTDQCISTQTHFSVKKKINFILENTLYWQTNSLTLHNICFLPSKKRMHKYTIYSIHNLS